MRSFRILTLAALAVSLYAIPSLATITVNGIDESRVSAYEGLAAGSTGIIIYGGMAGTCTGDAATSTSGTCSSCLAVSSSTPDNQLLPCNDRRINPNLVLSVTVTSSDHDGYPAVALGTASTSTGTVANTILRDSTTTSTTLVSKGSAATVNIPWAKICAAMTTTASSGTGGGAAIGADCVVPTTADGATGTFNFGVTANTTETTTTSSDDMGSVTIILRRGETAATATTAVTNGITYFELYSGDNKGTIGALQSASNSNFPVNSNIRFRWVRILFEQRASKNTPVWTTISSGSPHADLEIQSTSTDVNNLNLSPIIFSNGTGYKADGTSYSLGISNDHVYDAKVAVVDEARNVSFYTPAANDQDCETADGATNENARSNSSTGGSGLLECHTLRPAVVVGVLSNKVNCFIATASYGSPMANEVDTFRHFRDQYLIPTKLGLKFVRWYYNEGPKYAQFIRQSDTYRAVARGLLWLPLQFAKISLDYGIVLGLTFLFATLLAPLGLIYILIRKLRRGPTHA